MLRFDSIVFGPIHSRRLGSSLGINLLPGDGKICNFDCVYCECGWNADGRTGTKLPSGREVVAAMQAKIQEVASQAVHVDSITFSGHGEPTLHPEFAAIVDALIPLRDKYLPHARISVLSNATTLCAAAHGGAEIASHGGAETAVQGAVCPEDSMALSRAKAVIQALRKVDNPILKLDAPTSEFAAQINRPNFDYRVEDVVETLQQFKGEFVLQTMFLHGAGLDYSKNPEALQAWKDIVRTLRPRSVQVYSLDRPAPDKGLSKMDYDTLYSLVCDLIEEGFEIQITK